MYSIIRILQQRLIPAALLILALDGLTASAQEVGQDPGIPDTIRIGCPINAMGMHTGDSIAIPLYIISDSRVAGFVCGFTYNSDIVEITSFTKNPLIFTGLMISSFQARPASNSCLVGGISFNPQLNSISPGASLIGHFNLRLLQETPGTSIRIDSVFVPPAGPWLLSIDSANWTAIVDIKPQYVHCGQCDVGINTTCAAPTYACGDMDASAQVDITDAVYLINYIFGGGPAPHDEASGDIDCSNQTDITDAVYMINYIFGGGDPPCADCR